MLPLVPFACMPSLIPRQVWWNLFARTVPSASAFPRVSAGRLLRYTFRGLLSVHSRYGLHARQVTHVTLYTGGSDGFVTSTAAPIATEWNEPVLGRDFHPQRTSAFHGAQHSSTRETLNKPVFFVRLVFRQPLPAFGVDFSRSPTRFGLARESTFLRGGA